MSVNKVILLGNVGKDPEVRYVDADTPVANFTLATHERAYTTQSGANVPERTEWHNIVVWRGLAKVVEGYVRKGTPLYIEGKMRTRNWTDQNGITRYITEIYADNLELLGKRPEGGVVPLATAQPSAQPYQPQQPNQQPQPNPAPPNVSPPAAPAATTPFGGETSEGGGDGADDLPF